MPIDTGRENPFLANQQAIVCREIWTHFNPTKTLLTDLSLEDSRRLNYIDAMRYFFHIFDGSELHPDDVGNNLPSFEYAKRLAEVVADELKKGGEFSRSSLVVVADENDDVIFACGAFKRAACGESVG